MNKTDYLSFVKKHLHRIAPEAELTTLDPEDDLGATLDIDSMDFYRMMVAISDELGIEIPEEEYGKLRNLKNIVNFLESAVT